MGRGRSRCAVATGEAALTRQANEKAEEEPAAMRDLVPAYVRFGSKADAAYRGARSAFTPQSGHSIAALCHKQTRAITLG